LGAFASTSTGRAGWVGIASLVAIAVLFASNHVAARLAFDHGTSVATAVAVRSTGTALAVLALLVLSGTPVRVPGPMALKLIAVGLALSAQSYCLYSAVARLPVALALLTFNTFPLVAAALSWLTGGERPDRATLVAMPVILGGLVLALDAFGLVSPPAVAQATAAGAAAGADAGRFLAGIAYGLGASLSFGVALVLISRWLGPVDGRVRTVWTMATVALVVTVAGAASDGFALPADATGWVGLAALTVLYGAAITSLFVVLPRLGAVNNSPVLNAEPIAAMALAWAILDQRFAPLQVAGAVVVVGAIVWLSSVRR
jgi:drug/metabolite transporter (DMT)-like permease